MKSELPFLVIGCNRSDFPFILCEFGNLEFAEAYAQWAERLGLATWVRVFDRGLNPL